MKMITLKEAIELSKNKNYVIVDLRSKIDYQRNHILGAISLPNATVRTIENIGKKDKVWILYCSRGNYSQKLALYMEEKGYKVYSVIGGYRS